MSLCECWCQIHVISLNKPCMPLQVARARHQISYPPLNETPVGVRKIEQLNEFWHWWCRAWLKLCKGTANKLTSNFAVLSNLCPDRPRFNSFFLWARSALCFFGRAFKSFEYLHPGHQAHTNTYKHICPWIKIEDRGGNCVLCVYVCDGVCDGCVWWCTCVLFKQ